MKRRKLSKEKDKLYSLRTKGAPGSITELNPVLRELNLKNKLTLHG